MSWRTVQLGQELCDQDQLIIDLFGSAPVKYIGHDIEFARRLNIDKTAKNLVLILNQPQWCSDIVRNCRRYLNDIDKFYIGINRYTVLGNDTLRRTKTTGQFGIDLVDFLEDIVTESGFNVCDSGTFDRDLGRYFNFVQPLTWIYGTKDTDQGNQ